MDPDSIIQPADEDVSYDYQDAEEFRVWVMEGDWKEVIQKYEEHASFHKVKIQGRGTALHVAVSNANKDTVQRLVDAIVKRNGDTLQPLHLKDDRGDTPLQAKDDRGDTPLHLAAYRGFRSMCECIIGKNGERKDLVRELNEKKETPLFCAVLARNKETFLYLHYLFPEDISLVYNKDGGTILHVAIHREMFGMANIIMCLYPIIHSMEDIFGVTPLEILATRTSAFKSGNKLSWFKELLYKYCVCDRVWDAETRIKLYKNGLMFQDSEEIGEISIAFGNDESEKTEKVRLDFTSRAKFLCYCIQMFVFTIWHKMFPSQKKRWPTQSLWGKIKSYKRDHIHGRQLLDAFMKDPYLSYIGGGFTPYDDEKYIEEIDGSHGIRYRTHQKEGNDLQNMEDSKKNVEKDTTFSTVESGVVKIMKELNAKVPKKSEEKGVLVVAMKNIETNTKKNDRKKRAYLIAAKHGIREMLSELELRLQSVIYETNSNNENALLLAVKHRQPQVVEELWERLSMETFKSINQQVDKNENTILHLAAYTTKHNENTAWSIAGAAMQMMWDVKWYKYIKRLVPDHYHHRTNNDDKTPAQIFKEEHEDLLAQSITWLKDTSESCSVVAALVAGVSFATSGSVPGGNDKSGKPNFVGKPAFEAFSICSLIGLYFSVTALIMFLSILTSRKQVEDFNRNLPLKLLFGLSSLFVAIVAMFISFIAGHYFVLTDKYTKSGTFFYLYIAICLPLAFYGFVQLPLYIDLFKIICKKVPPPSIKGVKL